jgi:hypothetical protein
MLTPHSQALPGFLSQIPCPNKAHGSTIGDIQAAFTLELIIIVAHSEQHLPLAEASSPEC